MTHNTTIGNNILQFRTHMGLTQDALSNFLDIPRPLISYYETGAREVPGEVLLKLSDLFGCEVADLIDDNSDALNACLAFAFRADELDNQDLTTIAEFKKVVKNYLTLINLQRGSQG